MAKSEFATLFVDSANPVLDSLFLFPPPGPGDPAPGAEGSTQAIYRVLGQPDVIFGLFPAKEKITEIDTEQGLAKEHTLTIVPDGNLLQGVERLRINAQVLYDGLIWSVKDIQGVPIPGENDMETRLILSRGPIMQRSRPDHRMKR